MTQPTYSRKWVKIFSVKPDDIREQKHELTLMARNHRSGIVTIIERITTYGFGHSATAQTFVGDICEVSVKDNTLYIFTKFNKFKFAVDEDFDLHEFCIALHESVKHADKKHD